MRTPIRGGAHTHHAHTPSDNRDSSDRYARFLGIVIAVIAIGVLVAVASFGVALMDTGAKTTDAAGFTETPTLTAQSGDDLTVIVHIDDSHEENRIVTRGAADDDRTPGEPGLTVNGESLVVNSDNEVETSGGEPVTVGSDEKPIEYLGDGFSPDLRVDDDNDPGEPLTVDLDSSDGAVITANSGLAVEADGEPVVYPAFDDTNLEPDITAVSDAVEDDEVELTAYVNNTELGEVSDEDVEIRLFDADDDEIDDSDYEWSPESVSRESGEQARETFEIDVAAVTDDIERIELEVDGNTDEVETELDVSAVPIDVEITETNRPIAGQTLNVTAEFTPESEIAGEQDEPIEFTVGGSEQETNDLTLSGDETVTEHFRYSTENSDAPEVDVSVNTTTDSSEETVDVIGTGDHRQNMLVDIDDTNVGDLEENLTVNASFEYDGDLDGNETEIPATFMINGETEAETDVTVNDSDTVERTFEHRLNASDRPVTNATIDTPGENATETFDREFALEMNESAHELGINRTATATIDVTNDGETPGQDNLTVSIDNESAVIGNTSEQRTLQLNTSESVTESFVFELEDDAPPEIDLTAATSDMNETTTLTVEPRGIAVEDVEMIGAEEPGAELTIDADLFNSDDEARTEEINVTFNNQTVHTEEVSLEGGERKTLSTAIDPPAQPDTYEFGVTTAADEAESVASVQNIAEGGGGLFGFLTLSRVLFSVLGLVMMGALVVTYRKNPEIIQERTAGLKNTVQGIVGGGASGTVTVQNALPRPALVRVRIRQANEIVFIEDFEIGQGDKRKLTCLPDSGRYEVGCGIDDIASHTATFGEGVDDVGIILRPEGITIGQA